MIGRIDPSRVAPEQKAELIYAQARSDLASRLWRAALGEAGGESQSGPSFAPAAPEGGLDSLLALLAAAAPEATRSRSSVAAPAADVPTVTAAVAEPVAPATATATRAAGLGPNQRHQPALEAAAARTGIPAAALTAIVDAEAAKGRDGSWKVFSRNPRSSAAGLGQFLSGTWIGEAQRSGTWLNATAKARGWLSANGKVMPGARSELLSLRYDAEASINATADYARTNLDRLRKAGVSTDVGNNVEGIAHAAYLGHHLGIGDAVKFLKGGLDPSRARTLLHAQIGSASAERRIAEAGSAAGAHRSWLMNFVERKVRPDRFQSLA